VPGRIRLLTQAGEIDMSFALLGEHNRMNAAAAVAAALALDVSVAAISAGLAQVTAVAGRLQLRHGKRAEQILDDTYNANPASMRAGIEVLRGFAPPRYLVLGDMGELGADAQDLHAEIGRAAAAAELEGVLTLGQLAKAAADAFGAGAQSFTALDELLVALRALPKGAAMLVKGSRSARMERVVQALIEEAAVEGVR
jgi:UDP-N-acetylmuramoyl-tripeptide--D-alanyl-D-alanine ligase